MCRFCYTDKNNVTHPSMASAEDSTAPGALGGRNMNYLWERHSYREYCKKKIAVNYGLVLSVVTWVMSCCSCGGQRLDFVKPEKKASWDLPSNWVCLTHSRSCYIHNTFEIKSLSTFAYHEVRLRNTLKQVFASISVTLASHKWNSQKCCVNNPNWVCTYSIVILGG